MHINFLVPKVKEAIDQAEARLNARLDVIEGKLDRLLAAGGSLPTIEPAEAKPARKAVKS
jgi:hypothetical protein